NNLADWLLEEIPPDSTVVMVNYVDQFDSNLLTWYLGLRHRADLEPAVSAVLLEEPTAETLAAARHEILAGRPDFVVVFEGGPWGYPFWPDYTAALEDRLVLQDRRDFVAAANE